MRPAHCNMYGQPAYAVPQSPVHYYAPNHPPGNPPVPQYGRNPHPHGQEMAQPSQLQPVYLVHQQPVMHQYPAVVGVPTQVVGSPVPQAMAIQGVPAYGAAPQGWAYRPPMVEAPPREPVWGYSADCPRGFGDHQQQEPRVAGNWQRAPAPGYPGNGPGGFQGRVENGVGGPGSFQGRGDGHGNGQSFGKAGGEGRRPERGFESGNGSRHYGSGGPGLQHVNRQGPPPQSPAPSQAKQMSCEPCDKTFAVHSQYTAHMNTHVQCDELGCSFSASGKVVKEHKLTSHSKSSNPTPMSALKDASKTPEESSDEIKAWREERRRNYPTRLNIQRKKEILEGKVARGELIDEDARQRRQRMKEILAKQAELGVPVAEVPAYYLSNKDDRAKGRKNLDPTGKHMPATAGDGYYASTSAAESRKRKLGEDIDISTSKVASKSARVDADLAEAPTKSHREDLDVKVVAQADDRDEAGTSQPSDKPARTQCYFYQRGRCRKGPKCHFAHTRGKKGGDGEGGQGRRKGPAAAAASDKKRSPTLLSKLLQADINRDKSHILQCLRFFVNNNFLIDGILQPSRSSQLPLESDAAEDSSDYSEGEVVEAPDMLLADSAITNTLLSERPEVLAKVMELETHA